MEGNAKLPLHWDWDSPARFFGADYKHSTSSGLELGSGSSLRSTISVSADSSTKIVKESSGFYVDNSMSKDVGSCFRLLTETRSEDLPINLKFGKRNYLDNDSVESREERNTVSQLASVRQVPARVVRKTRMSQQSPSSISCQVDGCSDDLSKAKDYHRKHRVCPAHSKSFQVIIAGLERRFCQQCSRFQALSEFDEKKRSCRKRLSNHNARRRKPQPDIISFNSSIFASSAYDSQQINFLTNKPPSGCLISNANTTWQSSYDYGLPHEKEPWLKTTKDGRVDGSVNFQSMQLSNGTATHSCEINVQFPFRGTNAKVYQGSGAPIVASNLDRAPDLRHARSLLSAGSWVSPVPRQTSSFAPIAQSNNEGISAQSMMQSVDSTSGYWHDRKPQSKQARHFPFHLPDDNSQLDKAPPFLN